MNEPKLTRKNLYDLVWSTPLSTLAKNYQTTDNELRKICKKYEIPLPKNGYWMKVQYGKPVEVVELNENYNGDDEVVFVKSVGDMNVLTENRSPADMLQLEIENDPRINLKVPEELRNPTEIIKETQKELAAKKNHNYYQAINREIKYMNMDVSKDNIHRALRFMDTLIKALKARGHDVIINGWSTNVIILKQSIPVKIRESYKRVLVEETPYKRYEDVNNGILTFQLNESYCRNFWKDGKEKIEEKLSKIIAGLELIGKERYDREVERQNEKERRRQVYEVLKAKRDIVQTHLSKFKELVSDSMKYKKVTDMRAFIQAKQLGREDDKEVMEWVTWANEAVDWFDPLIKKEHPYLDDVNKETLEIYKMDWQYENWHRY